MTNDQDPEATIRALEAQLEAARAQARIEAMEAELAALKTQGAGTADAAADEAAAKAAEEAAAAAKAAEEAAAKEAAVRAAAQERAAAMEAELAALKAQQAGAAAAPAAAPAPAAPTQPAPAPHSVQAPKGRKGLVASLVVLTLALVATLGGTYFAIRGDIRAPWAAAPPVPMDVVLIGAADFGPAPAVLEPASLTVFEELSKPATGATPEAVPALSVTSVAGDTSEIYAVSNASCTYLSSSKPEDADALVAFLAALSADETLGINRALAVDDFSAFFQNLTFGHLLADTRVTYNGYSAGATFPMQAVLQRGTLVGFDRFGVPRVHCGSGVALTPPASGSGEIRFSGAAWDGLDLAALVTIAPASAPQNAFTVKPLGPSNVQSAFSVAPRVCAWSAPAACPEFSALVAAESPTPLASAPAPTPAECSNWAAGLTDADSVPARFVNASGSTVQVYMVQSQGAGCTTRHDLALGAGEASVLRYWPGTLVLLTDGASAEIVGQYVFGERTLFVIQ